jgi:carbamoyltransferase
MRILGISAFYHDSAAALIIDGKVMAAVQEERFSRKKHDSDFPQRSIEYIASLLPNGLADIDYVVYYEKPFIKFERLTENYLSFAPKGYKSFVKAMPLWLSEKLFQKKILLKYLKDIEPQKDWRQALLFSEHHLSHAASAFYPSPFGRAAVLTMDGVGEWTTTSVALGSMEKLEIIKEIQYPHSIGLLYSAMTYYLGFKVNSGEYKIMGLAPYGEPRYARTILENLIDVKDDGSYRLNLDYFDYCTGLTMTNSRFDALFDGPAREPEKLLTQREMDLAASVQAVTEEVVLRMGRSVAKETGEKNLCLAGGVALNCVANGKLLKAGIYDGIWVQPASGDAGGAIGAALAAYHLQLEQPRVLSNSSDGMSGSYLGPEYGKESIEAILKRIGASFTVVDDLTLIDRTVSALADGKAVGWFQGRMEFGPRALGGRSILGDPRSPVMQKLLNLKVKYRESFRPFAPAVLREDVSEWFDLDGDSPYMLFVAGVAERLRRKMTADEQKLFGIDKLNVVRSEIPAVTHVDYSARIQTVHSDTNPRFHALLSAFKARTGCPVLVNTSFNVRGEPIVASPEDAYRCFMGTELDLLAIGNCVLEKSEQRSGAISRYETQFALD